MNWKKICITTVIVLLLILLGACEFMLWYALSPARYDCSPMVMIEHVNNSCPWTKEWTNSLLENKALKEITTENSDGEKLHAYYVKASVPTKRVAILIHGYKDNSLRMLQIGYLYNHDLGWNIILPDLHAHGLSEGKNIQMGWLDRLDIEHWINVADSLFGGNTEIAIHGISMGGATTMMVSGDSLPKCVKLFVDDCGYTSVWDEFKGELKNQFGLPEFPLLYAANRLCGIQNGWTFSGASALNQVKKSTYPILFIHGDNDTYVPTWMGKKLYKAHTNGPRELWLAPGSAHAVSYQDHHEEYTKRVKSFINKYMN